MPATTGALRARAAVRPPAVCASQRGPQRPATQAAGRVRYPPPRKDGGGLQVDIATPSGRRNALLGAAGLGAAVWLGNGVLVGDTGDGVVGGSVELLESGNLDMTPQYLDPAQLEVLVSNLGEVFLKKPGPAQSGSYMQVIMTRQGDTWARDVKIVKKGNDMYMLPLTNDGRPTWVDRWEAPATPDVTINFVRRDDGSVQPTPVSTIRCIAMHAVGGLSTTGGMRTFGPAKWAQATKDKLEGERQVCDPWVATYGKDVAVELAPPTTAEAKDDIRRFMKAYLDENPSHPPEVER